MPSNAGITHFDGPLGCLFARDTAELATQLGGLIGLSPKERGIILQAANETLLTTLQQKLSRVLLLELNAARVQGRLEGDTPETRWDHFIAIASAPDYWDGLAPHYPPMPAMIRRLVENRCAAMLAFAQRWAADRGSLDRLCGGPLGELTAVSFGAGDSHCGGHAVALLTCEGGRVAYKPRSVAVEAHLRRLVLDLARDMDRPLAIRVPDVVEKGTHGWCEFIAHEYAADEKELAAFYEGIGHWLAVMRLVGGTDLHAENLIAHGPSPVIVDCETLFLPKVEAFPSGLGDAADVALKLISGTVLATGLLPGRGQGLGFRGLDMSGVGSLPGEQPTQILPDIIDAGTDLARIGMRSVIIAQSQNHPAEKPSLADYWPHVLQGFEELSACLRRLDADGSLRPRMAPFEDCRIRVVVRATEVYAELSRMLWHPVSLHNPGKSLERARDLLAKMAQNVSLAPSDPDVIVAEVNELLAGDIPYFSTIAKDGVLEGPAGTHWLPPRDLVTEAWQSWRDTDLSLERSYVQAALVSAYVNDGWTPDAASFRPASDRHGELDARRRKQAASIMQRLVSTAMHGSDGTVTWVAPALAPAGWSVQSLNVDLYAGISGVALLTGAYVRETKAGRADAVAGADALLTSLMRTLDAFDEKRESEKRKGYLVRPSTPGGYMGLASQIWARLLLSDWGLDEGDGIDRAIALAREIPAAAAADEVFDLLSGKSGAIPVLLALARKTDDGDYLRLATALGDDLCGRADYRGGLASWPLPRWPEGIGGYAHGATGIGWALHRLARETGEARFRKTADAAFAFEETLFDEDEQNWIDLRRLDGAKTAAAWCHGSVGIGLARLDLDPTLKDESARRDFRRAAAATWRMGFGWNHSACHGDTGAWELMSRAIDLGEGPEGLTQDGLLASMLTSLEDNGPICGLVRDAFVPGLFPGLGGVAYQLLRANPQSNLPSILVLGDEA